MTAAAALIKVTFFGGTEELEGSGFITEWNWGDISNETIGTASGTIKWAGLPVWADV